MASVTLFPSSYTLGTNGANFQNPGNLYSDNGVYATVIATVKSTTSQLFLAGFDFSSIPAGSTINSVVVKVDRKMSTTSSIQSVTIQAYKAAVAMGTKATDASEPTVDTVLSNSNTGSWAYADLANLRVLLEDIRGNSTVACTVSYDYVAVTIDYTPKNANGTLSVSQSSTIDITGTKKVNGSLSVSQASSVSVSGKKDAKGSLSVSQDSSVSIAGVAALTIYNVNGSLSVSQSSSVSIIGNKNASGTLSVNQGSTPSISGKKTAKGSFSVSLQSSIDVSGLKGSKGSLQVVQSGGVAVSGKKNAKGQLSVSQSSVIAITGYQTNDKKEASGSLNVTQENTITITGKKNAYGHSSVSIPSTVFFDGSKNTLGHLEVNQGSTIRIRSTTIFTTVKTDRKNTLLKIRNQSEISKSGPNSATKIRPKNSSETVVMNNAFRKEVIIK